MKDNESVSPSGDQFLKLKQFSPTHRGPWQGVGDAQWNDHRWQLQNRITRLDQLEKLINLTPAERAGVLFTNTKLSMAITPHFFSLIDVDDPACPIRRQVIPRLEETEEGPFDMADPCGEDSHSPVPGLVHRYPDRVLFLVTDRCASYCRYCTRSRVVSGAGEQHLETDFDRAIGYIREHPEIRDVLLSGGDPLLLSDEKLDHILSRLRAIPHVEFIRIGTRIPIFLPQRITPELCAMLRRYHPLWMSVHTNHPRELTTEVRDALGRLADAGIPLGNQAVLLHGVNDRIDTMKALLHKLLMCRVRPYYIYQCDLIKGSSHLRVPVRKGMEIMENLRGHTTGYAVPTYVIDAPGGGGKVPVAPGYVLESDEERTVVRNYEGRVFEYPEPGAPRRHRRSEPAYDLEWEAGAKW
ncbi:MAG: KamA family radical SAM protein [Verrucomicrobiae bacterium]|nr:KamA family radical SAM protein [Verrucomicrobiae bacterium]